MNKVIILFMLGIWLFSCKNSDDDEGVDCSIYDPIFPELYIRLVDENGNNLIQNGSIDPEEITVEGNFSYPFFSYVPAHDFVDATDEIRALDHTLNLHIPYQSAFIYTLHLNPLKTIKLEIKAEQTELPCNVHFYIPNQIMHNNNNIPINKLYEYGYIYLAEIEL